MINILLSGCNGKMGQVISRISLDYENVQIVAGIDMTDSKKNYYPCYKNLLDIKEQIDVIIDFSNTESLDNLLLYSVENKKALVIATTGHTNEQIQAIQEASKHTAIFMSSNMSVGVNLIIDLIKKASKILEDNFDIEIIEKHHNQKIDAPSGTALSLAEAINSSLSVKKEYVFDRHSKRQKRSKNEIGMHAIRGGTIVGEHSVIFAGNEEIIEIKHIALSRDIFGNGALRAAIFMVGKAPGLYSMKEIVG